jgi:hypothetical protein
MSFYQTADAPNFSVYPSRDRRAPYGTIHNLPNILDVTSYDGSTLPVTLLSAGSLFVSHGSDITIALPDDATLFAFLNGNKYLADGDVIAIEVINRGNGAAIFTHGEGPISYIIPGTCDCMVLQWTIPTQNNQAPYYTILPGQVPIA